MSRPRAIPIISSFLWDTRRSWIISFWVLLALASVVWAIGFWNDNNQLLVLAGLVTALSFLSWNLPSRFDALFGLGSEHLRKTPPANRRGLELNLIGRSGELASLRSLSSDGLLVGQPGIGKSRLLAEVTEGADTYFVLPGNKADLRSEIKSTKPMCIIVDDAHTQQGLVEQLLQLRADENLTFKLLLCGWPSYSEEMATRFEIPANRIIYLEKLRRNDILKIVQQILPNAIDPVLRELVGQADGLPGLAVVLAHTLKEREYESVQSGSAALTTIAGKFDRELSQGDRLFLGLLSVSGNSGMSIKKASTLLGASRFELEEKAAKLATGGVLEELEGGSIRVRPPIIRNRLIDEAFVERKNTISLAEAVTNSNDPQVALRTLIESVARGINLPINQLQKMVSNSKDPETWNYFASLGEQQAEWVLDSDSHASQAFTPGLDLSPQRTIEKIYQSVKAELASSQTSESLEILERFVFSQNAKALEIREAVISEALEGFNKDNDDVAATALLSIALSPKFEDSHSDPGEGNTFTLSLGAISLEHIRALRTKLPLLGQILEKHDFAAHTRVLEIVSTWAYPSRLFPGSSPEGEAHEVMKEGACELVKMSAEKFSSHLGYYKRLEKIAAYLECDIEIETDPAFNILFPTEDYSIDHEERESQWDSQLDELLTEMKARPISETAGALARYDKEGHEAGLGYPRLIPNFCRKLAQELRPYSYEFLKELTKLQVGGDLLFDFLKNSIEDEPKKTRVQLQAILARDCSKYAAASAVLTTESATEEMLDDVSQILPQLGSGAASSMAWSNSITKAGLRRLLACSDPAVASSAAERYWMNDRHDHFDDDVLEAWEAAIVRLSLDNHHYESVFTANPHLIRNWFGNLISSNELTYFSPRRIGALCKLAQNLDTGEKLDLLREANETNAFVRARWARVIICDDLDAYRILLSEKGLETLHLAPLKTQPSKTWLDMAEAAIDAGHSPRAIAEVALFSETSIHGEASTFWKNRAQSFESLLGHSNPRLQKVGEIAIEIALRESRAELVRERHEQVHGRE